MPPALGHPSSLLIRWVHVLAMAVLLGGAALLWGALREGYRENHEPALHAATTYEWLFWAGAGLLVVTGIGNLGALAPAIPAVGTVWGRTFTVKLLAVVVLLVGSLPRTMAVALAAGASSPSTDRLRAAYATTALYLLFVVALAEVLAHG